MDSWRINELIAFEYSIIVSVALRQIWISGLDNGNFSFCRLRRITIKLSPSEDIIPQSIFFSLPSIFFSKCFFTYPLTNSLRANMAIEVATRKCMGLECENNAGSLQCPTCLKMGTDSFFCSQDCFKRSWVRCLA
jgi:hypothetical protein